MNVLVAYYSRTGSTEMVAATIERQLAKMGHSVRLLKIFPKRELKASEYDKDGRDVELKEAPPKLEKFDLIAVGTPVWGFSPSPIVLSFLRGLGNAEGKRFALFATCMAIPGTTMKRMDSILSTKGAMVAGSITVKSIFPLDEAKLSEARRFAEELGKSAK